MSEPPRDVTVLLTAVSSGDHSAKEKLYSILYDELHNLSHHYLRKENPGHMLQTTALINEAYLRLVEDNDIRWNNRTHFFAVAARAMRRILVSEARRRRAAKRGSGLKPVPLEKVGDPDGGDQDDEPTMDDLEALDKALDKLAADEKNRRMCTVLELRFFAGLTHEETAEVLEVSEGTVRRDWRFAKAWLHREMTRD